ncbi:unnamed protein product, partial [Mesorhabditis spiculigera]
MDIFVTDTLFYTICDCMYYAVPGYYGAYKTGKAAVEGSFTLFDNILKLIMFGALIGTDIAIVAKLYRMKVLGNHPRRRVEAAPPTVMSTHSEVASPRSATLMEPNSNGSRAVRRPMVREIPKSQADMGIEHRVKRGEVSMMSNHRSFGAKNHDESYGNGTGVMDHD